MTTDDHNLNFLVKHMDCILSGLLLVFSSLLIANILNYFISNAHPPFSDESLNILFKESFCTAPYSSPAKMGSFMNHVRKPFFPCKALRMNQSS